MKPKRAILTCTAILPASNLGFNVRSERKDTAAKKVSSFGKRKLRRKLERLVFSFYTNLIRFRTGVNKLRVTS